MGITGATLVGALGSVGALMFGTAVLTVATGGADVTGAAVFLGAAIFGALAPAGGAATGVDVVDPLAAGVLGLVGLSIGLLSVTASTDLTSAFVSTFASGFISTP